MSTPTIHRADALFISPHLDDVALSCGGTVALEARAGGALVVTVFAGQPSGPLNPFARFQHRRWGFDDAVEERWREDAAAMAVLGVRALALDFPDAIYRGDLYLSDDDLFGEIKPEDTPVAAAVADSVSQIIAQVQPQRVYLPLGVGQHVDHQICSALACRLSSSGLSILFYEEIPYSVAPGAVEQRVGGFGSSLAARVSPVADAFERRLAAIRCYTSQLSTIFRDFGDPEQVVRRYARSIGSGEYAERFWEFANSRIGRGRRGSLVCHSERG